MRRHPEIYDEATRGWLAQRLLMLRNRRKLFQRLSAEAGRPAGDRAMYGDLGQQLSMEMVFGPHVMAEYFRFLMGQAGEGHFRVNAFRNPDLTQPGVMERPFYGPEAQAAATAQYERWVADPRYDAVYLFSCHYRPGRPDIMESLVILDQHEEESYIQRSWAANYDEPWDEDDDEVWEEETGRCETCGGEWGEGWSMCSCDDDEEPDELVDPISIEADGWVCPDCGGELDSEACEELGCEDGWIDVYDEDPLWYDPGDMERCEACAGAGRLWRCEACKAWFDLETLKARRNEEEE